jgi:hypothetical protein
MPRPRQLFLILAGATLTAVGCYVQSIEPLYTDKTRAYDDELVGTWVSDEDEEYVFSVTDTTRGSYTLVCDEAGSRSRFEAVLTELGEAAFLDIYPEEPENENSFYVDHLVRVHNILRLEMDADTLWVSDFDAEWLQTAITKKRVKLSYVPLDGAILLTAPTDELQAFVRKYSKTREAFSEPAKFIRSN